MRTLRAALAVSAVCLLQGVSSAGTLMVAGSGVFSGNAPTTTYSAPNTAWSFNFLVPDVPVVSNATTNGFDVPFSSFTYQLGGTTLNPTPDRIRFFIGAIGGLFNIDIAATATPDDNPITGFEFSGAQAFSNTTSNPTITTGTFTASPASFFSNGAQVDSFSGVINITSTGGAVSTPEPATFAVAGAACCLFAWMRRRRSVR